MRDRPRRQIFALSPGGFAETNLDGVGFAVTQDTTPGRSSNNARDVAGSVHGRLWPVFFPFHPSPARE